MMTNEKLAWCLIAWMMSMHGCALLFIWILDGPQRLILAMDKGTATIIIVLDAVIMLALLTLYTRF